MDLNAAALAAEIDDLRVYLGILRDAVRESNVGRLATLCVILAERREEHTKLTGQDLRLCVILSREFCMDDVILLLAAMDAGKPFGDFIKLVDFEANRDKERATDGRPT